MRLSEKHMRKQFVEPVIYTCQLFIVTGFSCRCIIWESLMNSQGIQDPQHQKTKSNGNLALNSIQFLNRLHTHMTAFRMKQRPHVNNLTISLSLLPARLSPSSLSWRHPKFKGGRGKLSRGQKSKQQWYIYLCKMGNCSVGEEVHSFGEDSGRKSPCHVFSRLLPYLCNCHRQTRRWEVCFPILAGGSFVRMVVISKAVSSKCGPVTPGVPRDLFRAHDVNITFILI